MKPIKFKGHNLVVAKDQSEYQQLPVHRSDDGTLISCWSLTWRERIKLLFTGRLWHSVMTFNQPLQPQLLSVDNPLKETP